MLEVVKEIEEIEDLEDLDLGNRWAITCIDPVNGEITVVYSGNSAIGEYYDAYNWIDGETHPVWVPYGNGS